MVRAKPKNYGRWWNTHGGGLDWYEKIWRHHPDTHRFTLNWLNSIRQKNELKSVLEIGCGACVFYPMHVFGNILYTGMDVSDSDIRTIRKLDKYNDHHYQVGDFIEMDPPSTYDLVFSHATIDHVWDIDEFIRRSVIFSRGWIFHTVYRGFYKGKTHKYNYKKSQDCFYNDVSSITVKQLLESLGCRNIMVNRLDTPNNKRPCETVILAQVPLVKGVVSK